MFESGNELITDQLMLPLNRPNHLIKRCWGDVVISNLLYFAPAN
jgi:hypothetical protein